MLCPWDEGRVADHLGPVDRHRSGVEERRTSTGRGLEGVAALLATSRRICFSVLIMGPAKRTCAAERYWRSLGVCASLLAAPVACGAARASDSSGGVAEVEPSWAGAAPATSAPVEGVSPPAPTASTSAEVPDPCDPLPKEGTPCTPPDTYCVESWGQPGGYSSALWCRGGRWTREEEHNLP